MATRRPRADGANSDEEGETRGTKFHHENCDDGNTEERERQQHEYLLTDSTLDVSYVEVDEEPQPQQREGVRMQHSNDGTPTQQESSNPPYRQQHKKNKQPKFKQQKQQLNQQQVDKDGQEEQNDQQPSMASSESYKKLKKKKKDQFKQDKRAVVKYVLVNDPDQPQNTSVGDAVGAQAQEKVEQQLKTSKQQQSRSQQAAHRTLPPQQRQVRQTSKQPQTPAPLSHQQYQVHKKSSPSQQRQQQQQASPSSQYRQAHQTAPATPPPTAQQHHTQPHSPAKDQQQTQRKVKSYSEMRREKYQHASDVAPTVTPATHKQLQQHNSYQDQRSTVADFYPQGVMAHSAAAEGNHQMYHHYHHSPINANNGDYFGNAHYGGYSANASYNAMHYPMPDPNNFVSSPSALVLTQRNQAAEPSVKRSIPLNANAKPFTPRVVMTPLPSGTTATLGNNKTQEPASS